MGISFARTPHQCDALLVMRNYLWNPDAGEVTWQFNWRNYLFNFTFNVDGNFFSRYANIIGLLRKSAFSHFNLSILSQRAGNHGSNYKGVCNWYNFHLHVRLIIERWKIERNETRSVIFIFCLELFPYIFFAFLSSYGLVVGGGGCGAITKESKLFINDSLFPIRKIRYSGVRYLVKQILRIWFGKRISSGDDSAERFRSEKYRYEKKLWQSDTINRGHRLSSSRIKAKNVNNK